MSRETKLIIYGLIIMFSVIYKRVNVIMNSVPLEIATEKPALPTFEYAEPPGKLPANEEALNILFNLAVNEGYTKDLDAFRELMANDEEARAAAFDLAVEDGYTKDINAFTELVGGVTVKLAANEEAINHAFGLFTSDGYGGNIDAFKAGIADNKEMFDHAFRLFVKDAYGGSEADFATLMGVDPGKANVQSAGVVDHPRPQQGFSPYDEYFGRGIYDKSVGNEFVIKNSNSTDAVVLLVNAYTKRKTRNEYIRKGATFKMTSVPNGTYYLEWTSGEAWNPNLYLGKVRGGFQENSSYAKTGDRNDWMQVSGWDQWTVTLYTTTDGDVNLEDINANEFGK